VHVLAMCMQLKPDMQPLVVFSCCTGTYSRPLRHALTAWVGLTSILPRSVTVPADSKNIRSAARIYIKQQGACTTRKVSASAYNRTANPAKATP
jgi:hypothetical protein